MATNSGGNIIAHRYSKSFTSHDGCLCGKRTLFDGIWEPTIKLTLSANTAGAITAEFHADCIRKFLQSNRKWGWTPHLKRDEQKELHPSDRRYAESDIPEECVPIAYAFGRSEATTVLMNNLERGSFPRSTCIVSKTKQNVPAIKFHLTNGRDCVVHLTALETLLASEPEPLACNPIKVVISHLFFDKGTLEECQQKLRFLGVSEKKEVKLVKEVTAVSRLCQDIQAFVAGKRLFQAFNLFHCMHRMPVVVDQSLLKIVQGFPTPTILDLKEDHLNCFPNSFPQLRSFQNNQTIQSMKGAWQKCTKFQLKWSVNWEEELAYYGLSDALITIGSDEGWSGYDYLIEFLAKGSPFFVNGKCIDASYIAEGLVSPHSLVRQIAAVFQRKAHEN